MLDLKNGSPVAKRKIDHYLKSSKMPTVEELITFVENFTGSENINAETDIFDDGTCGDDFDELIDAYAKNYSVDMTNYLWYFHTNEEGSWNSIGGAFFEPPNKKVKRIPITPLLLADFAIKGKWDLDYPKHNIAKKRYDILINQVLLIGVLVWLIIAVVRKC